MNSLKKNVSLAMNLAVVFFEITAFSMTFSVHGTGIFIYFTELSNIFGGIVCAVMASFLIRELITKKEVPAAVSVLKYVAACALALTFFTVIFVLVPLSGFTLQNYKGYMLEGSVLFTHTLNPLLAMLSCIFVDEGKAVENFKVTFLGFIPTFLYATISVILNIMRVWVGPYPFLKVYENGAVASVIWVFVMFGFSFLLCAGIWKGRKMVS